MDRVAALNYGRQEQQLLLDVRGQVVDLKPGEDLIVNERNIGGPHNEHVEVPTLTGDLAAIPAKVKPAGAPLTFKTDGIGKPSDVTLVPYFRIAHQHYNMYWKIEPA